MNKEESAIIQLDYYFNKTIEDPNSVLGWIYLNEIKIRVIFSTLEKAKEILSDMNKIINNYENVNVTEFLFLSTDTEAIHLNMLLNKPNKNNFTKTPLKSLLDRIFDLYKNYGWTNLVNVKIMEYDRGFIINFPPPILNEGE